MRFLFVDQITGRTGNGIVGRRTFRLDEPLRYTGPDVGCAKGGTHVAPGAVSEAIGQLASWLCLERNGFSARPVFLFADRIEVLASVRTGEAVMLDATMHEMDDQSLRFSGRASVQGRVVQTVKDCSGYFMPLAELEDPAVTRARFQTLTSGVLALEGAGGPPYPLAALAGETLSLTPFDKVHTRTTFAPDAPFYADHFPRFPVTPIVILNEMIGQVTARVAGVSGAEALQIRAINGIKIRSFVRPGETCETVVTVSAMRETGATKTLEAIAEIVKDGKRILRGSYTYEFLPELTANPAQGSDAHHG